MGLGRAVAPVAFVAALMLAPISWAQSDDDGDDIEWAHMTGIRVGDFWRFELSGTERGWVHNEVKSIGPYTSLLNEEYTALNIHVSGELTTESSTIGFVPTELDGDKWVNQSDLASIQIDGVTSVEDAQTRELNQTYEPPLIDVVFPFTLGYEWYAESNWSKVEAGESSVVAVVDAELIKWRGKVAGREALAVPAGTFDAWRIDYTQVNEHGGVQAFSRWYVEEVCDIAKEVHYDAEGQVIRTMVLTSFRCAADEVDQPTYDTDHVSLLSRGVAGGTTGATREDLPPDPDSVPRQPVDDGETGDRRDSPAAPYAVAILTLAGVALFAFGRRRA